MAGINTGPNSEQQRASCSLLLGFLKNSETKYPGLSKQLPELLSGMLEKQTFNPELMVKGEDYIRGGIAALGEWLARSGFEGYSVQKLDPIDLTAKAAIENSGAFPSRDEFFAKSGVSKENWPELQNVLVDLSRAVRGALGVGYQAKQIVAFLFIQSTVAYGDERPETSIPTREMLKKASGGKLQQVNMVLNSWGVGKNYKPN